MQNASLFNKLKETTPSQHAVDMSWAWTVRRSPSCACQASRAARVHILGSCPETHHSCGRSTVRAGRTVTQGRLCCARSVCAPCCSRACLPADPDLPLHRAAATESSCPMPDAIGFLLRYQRVERRKCRVSLNPPQTLGSRTFIIVGANIAVGIKMFQEVSWTTFCPWALMPQTWISHEKRDSTTSDAVGDTSPAYRM